MNCCDSYGNCRQGRDCPVRLALMSSKEEFPCCDNQCNQNRYCLRRKDAAECCTELGSETNLPLPTRETRWKAVLVDLSLAGVLLAVIAVLVGILVGLLRL